MQIKTSVDPDLVANDNLLSLVANDNQFTEEGIEFWKLCTGFQVLFNKKVGQK